MGGCFGEGELALFKGATKHSPVALHFEVFFSFSSSLLFTEGSAFIYFFYVSGWWDVVKEEFPIHSLLSSLQRIGQDSTIGIHRPPCGQHAEDYG